MAQRGDASVAVMFAFDAGFGVDLRKARERLTALDRSAVRAPRRDTLVIRPEPLTFRRTLNDGAPTPTIGLEATSFASLLEFTIFDFGAVSVTFRANIQPTTDPAADLARLARVVSAIGRDERLRGIARSEVEALLTVLSDAVIAGELLPTVEDYVLVHIPSAAIDRHSGEQALAWVDRRAHELASVLRGPTPTDAPGAGLSAQQVSESLAHRVSWREDEVVIVDYSAALIIAHDASEAEQILEFANVELLEMRCLDDRLDEAMESAYRLLAGAERVGKFDWLGRQRRAGERVARMQADSAVLFEGVNNALKLVGDHYLARLYRAGAERFHLAEWDSSILRKLAAVDAIYRKLEDERSGRRTEFLEWIIIALIAFEIVMTFVGIR